MSHLAIQVFGQRSNLTARDLEQFEKDLQTLATSDRLLFDLIGRAKQLMATIAILEVEEASRKMEEISLQEQKFQKGSSILGFMQATTNSDFIQRAKNDLATFSSYLQRKNIRVLC